MNTAGHLDVIVDSTQVQQTRATKPSFTNYSEVTSHVGRYVLQNLQPGVHAGLAQYPSH